MSRTLGLFLAALLFAATAQTGISVARQSQTTAHVSCSDGSLQLVGSHTHGKRSACIVKPHRAMVETTYYQNASKVGGSALAAFPEMRLRYGLARHIELFVDPPSEIAKSGLRGTGIYFMSRIGLGAKVELPPLQGIATSLSLESHPPLEAMAYLKTFPLFDMHLDSSVSLQPNLTANVEVGTLAFRQYGMASRMLGYHEAFSLTRALGSSFALTGELRSQSRVAFGSAAQSTGTLALSRLVAKHVLANIEIGTAFNATGNSKPHYFGATFSIR